MNHCPFILNGTQKNERASQASRKDLEATTLSADTMRGSKYTT